MNATDNQRQESESDVFDVEKGDGKKYEMKRCHFCIYSIIIPSVVAVIMVVLVMIIGRKLIPQWSSPLIISSAAETTSYQMSKTEFMALEGIKRETRVAAHLFYNPGKKCNDESNCVMWGNSQTSDSFVSEGIIFHSNNGSLQVNESGIYQVYSKLTLKHIGRKSAQKQSYQPSYSTIQRNGKLLSIEHFNFPLPDLVHPDKVNMYHVVLHFGIYHLNASDTLFVTMDKDSIKYLSNWARDSFFGLNLIIHDKYVQDSTV